MLQHPDDADVCSSRLAFLIAARQSLGVAGREVIERIASDWQIDEVDPTVGQGTSYLRY